MRYVRVCMHMRMYMLCMYMHMRMYISMYDPVQHC